MLGFFRIFKQRFTQGCGSGSGLDPDSATLWIRIRIGNPDPRSGSRGKKFQWKNALFSYLKKNFTTKKLQNSTNYFLNKILMNNTVIFYLI
jgi:hypothetical protein